MMAAVGALDRLKRGNRRFVRGERRSGADALPERRRELVAGQEPFAVVLGCADSRVPVELVFDQGPGDLFVIRLAGNVVVPPVVGSVEFAAGQLGTRLVVVLGHTGCGAVAATLAELVQPQGIRSKNLRSIVDRIRPAVEGLLETELRHDPEALAREAVRANVRASADRLRHGSELLEELIDRDGLVVVGGEYDLESGRVVLFDGVPAES